MHPHRKKRIYSILLVFFFSALGVSLILFSLNSNLDYFFSPKDLTDKIIPENKRLKMGGMVLENSVFRDQSKIYFVVTDYESSVKVEYEGIVPDLFQEGSGVVVLGYLKDDLFIAEEVLAKHDENYMPPDLKIPNDS